jgi:hypothetical protein
MPTINATPLSTTANSFGTLAEADDYLANKRLNGGAWAVLAQALRETALIQACALLERGFTWAGSIRTIEQKLSWPRSGVEDPNGRWYSYDTVPDIVKEAQFELAFALTVKDRIAGQEPDLLGKGFSRVKLDVIDIDVDPNQVLGAFPPWVVSHLAGVGEPKQEFQTSGMKQIKLVR